MLGNVVMLAAVLGNVAKMAGASSRIITMMQKIPGVNTRGGEVIAENKIESVIELKDLSFSYPTKQEVEVAKNINLKVQ